MTEMIMNETPPKFYHAENANRILKSDRFRFAFDPVEHIGGTWRGIYATVSPEEQAALGKLTADKRSAVTEISREEYEQCLKKKSKLSQTTGVLALPQAAAPVDQSPLIPQAAPTAGEPISSEFPTPASTEVKPLESVEAALSVGPVNSAPTAAMPPAGETTGCDLT